MTLLIALAVVLLAFGASVAVAVSGWSDLVGTRSRQRSRREEILRSFDGRPEVKVRATGAGMTPEETALLGHRHGYVVIRWQTRRGAPPYLVMRRATGPAPAVGFGPPPPAGRLTKAPNPEGRSRQRWALLMPGLGSGYAAFDSFRSGGSVVLPGTVAVVFLGGAAALTLHYARSDRRRAAVPPPGVPTGPQTPPYGPQPPRAPYAPPGAPPGA
ncbi:hypothetical protein [Streptomyces catenulae]|uniref:DUF3592 domain-containing protein n=1 Tax=Streptomyces catenulae TaxID=66875 RepID=A0ABV2YTJ5_9ACTN|nr:hypothetical protein [Streptomyces catenulae]